MATKAILEQQKEKTMRALIDLTDAILTKNASVKHKNLLIRLYNDEVDKLDKIINSKNTNNNEKQ